ncbi:hypothetical protein EYR27_23020 [Xanthomonas oryzae]|nr:hypothetical protein EYR27_23020 [Xanthomonas oryzae]
MPRPLSPAPSWLGRTAAVSALSASHSSYPNVASSRQMGVDVAQDPQSWCMPIPSSGHLRLATAQSCGSLHLLKPRATPLRATLRGL